MYTAIYSGKTMSFKVFDQAEQLARELETLEKEGSVLDQGQFQITHVSSDCRPAPSVLNQHQVLNLSKN